MPRVDNSDAEARRLGRAAKGQWRTKALALRRSLSADRVADTSRQVGATLADLTRDAVWIHTYIGGRDNEIDTRFFVEACLARGQRVAVPVVVAGQSLLEHAELRGWDDLEVGHWGLLQPKGISRLNNLNVLDFIVVPGVAFDGRGHRLGYGKGYYDRFLAASAAYKIGTVDAALLFDTVPIQAHDVAVDAVVTDKAVHFIRPLDSLGEASI